MNQPPPPSTVPPSRRRVAFRRAVVALVVAAVAGSGLVATAAQAVGQRVNLRLLLVSDGGPASSAFAAELGRQGVPFTTVDLADAARPRLTQDFLEDDAAGTGRFQGVLLPNQAGGGLGADELAALAAYEREYAVRQVNGYDFPTTSMGLVNQWSGSLDGTPATVTAAGLAGPFRYLTGRLAFEDADPAVLETFGYVAQPVSPMPEGTSYTPYVSVTTSTGVSGSVLGVHTSAGREELVLTASVNQYMQWGSLLLPGIVEWVTRGVHLGYRRAYLNVHIDDIFLPDSRWSVDGNCTPGDDCVDPAVTTPDIRMTPADVTRLVQWQQANGVRLDMVYNGGGSEAAAAANGGTDPLTTALLAAKDEFRWINHTWSHPYLGCIQIAPTVQGQPWTCATSPTQTPRQDPEVPQQLSGGVYWASQAFLTDQVVRNRDWGVSKGLPNFAVDELVTGEHSGLRSLPNQPQDNPFLAPALQAAGIAYTGSDASREPDARTIGVTTTVPRHPMNIYYNTATYREQIDEYNWYYTSRANGGSGICEDNPATSTCITPLPSATAAEAKASFDSYLKVVEARNALKFVLTNDPAPFYAHQSNLAEDGLLYPVLEEIVRTYAAAVDRTRSPLVQTGMAGQAQARQRLQAWDAVDESVTAYVDARGVHVPDAAADVPLTVPEGSRGGRLEGYAGSLSGWQASATTVALPSPAGGYLVETPATAPGVPDAGVATAGNASAALSWTAPVTDGGSPLTAYVVRAFAAGSTTPAATAVVAPGALSGTVTGLANGTSYRLSVAAVNAVGESAQSGLSTAVTPSVANASVPQAVAGDDGNASATVTWVRPAVTAGVTGWRLRVYLGTSTTASLTATLDASRTSAQLTGLTNGRAYTADVTPVFGTTTGTSSTRTEPFTPALSAQTASAPSLASVTPGLGVVDVAWAAPADNQAGAVTGYRVRAYAGTTSTTAARDVTVGADVRSLSLTGLAVGTAYTVDVTVLRSASTGPLSARSVAVVPVATAPSAPVVGAASSGSLGWPYTAVARWSPPASEGGSPVTGYLVTAVQVDSLNRPTGATQSSGWLSATSRSWTMTDLLFANRRYYFTVQARNAIGVSPASAPSDVVVQR